MMMWKSSRTLVLLTSNIREGLGIRLRPLPVYSLQIPRRRRNRQTHRLTSRQPLGGQAVYYLHYPKATTTSLYPD